MEKSKEIVDASLSDGKLRECLPFPGQEGRSPEKSEVSGTSGLHPSATACTFRCCSRNRWARGRKEPRLPTPALPPQHTPERNGLSNFLSALPSLIPRPEASTRKNIHLDEPSFQSRDHPSLEGGRGDDGEGVFAIHRRQTKMPHSLGLLRKCRNLITPRLEMRHLLRHNLSSRFSIPDFLSSGSGKSTVRVSLKPASGKAETEFLLRFPAAPPPVLHPGIDNSVNEMSLRSTPPSRLSGREENP